MKTTLLFLTTSFAFLGLADLSSRQKDSDFIHPAYAEPQTAPKTAESGNILPERGLGAQEIPRSDGGKDRVYYSVTTPEEERRNREEEKEKTEKSLDVLPNIIIDRRHR